jgi:hypothetical protein
MTIRPPWILTLPMRERGTVFPTKTLIEVYLNAYLLYIERKLAIYDNHLF